MDSLPFWSQPSIVRAAGYAIVSLGALFLAGAGAIRAWTWWVGRRERDAADAADRDISTRPTPRDYRRDSDRRLGEVERGLAIVSGKVSGLERDAAFLTDKANGLGRQMGVMQDTQTTLLRFMDKANNDNEWIKAALVRLENAQRRNA
jgi:hypothetical protein